MTHVEKIIQGIEVCMDYISDCNQCPYNETDGMECLEALRDDVIALLKAQEPRVLTLEEMEQAGKIGEAVYVETPNDGCFWALAYPGEEPPKDKPFNYPGGVRFNAVEVNGDICDGDFYGMTLPDGRVHFLAWRAWTSRPTNEQMEATPWES